MSEAFEHPNYDSVKEIEDLHEQLPRVLREIRVLKAARSANTAFRYDVVNDWAAECDAKYAVARLNAWKKFIGSVVFIS